MEKTERPNSVWYSTCCNAPVTGMEPGDDLQNDPVTCSSCQRNLGVKMYDMYFKQ